MCMWHNWQTQKPHMTAASCVYQHVHVTQLADSKPKLWAAAVAQSWMTGARRVSGELIKVGVNNKCHVTQAASHMAGWWQKRSTGQQTQPQNVYDVHTCINGIMYYQLWHRMNPISPRKLTLCINLVKACKGNAKVSTRRSSIGTANSKIPVVRPPRSISQHWQLYHSTRQLSTTTPRTTASHNWPAATGLQLCSSIASPELQPHGKIISCIPRWQLPQARCIIFNQDVSPTAGDSKQCRDQCRYKPGAATDGAAEKVLLECCYFVSLCNKHTK
jgi:hypothetical protein